MTSRISTASIFYIASLFFAFLSVNATATTATKVSSDFPAFSKKEIQIIKTLSSQRYTNTSDVSNHVSGSASAIAFGKQLFFSKKLSGDGVISCASCHNPKEDWATHDAITVKRTAYPSTRHVPSLWGVKYNRWYFWDGRADSLWSQALQPIENISEMRGSRVQIARLLISDFSFRKSYEAIFGRIPTLLLHAKLPFRARPVETEKTNADHLAWVKLKPPVQHAINTLFSNVGKSIAAFEETLVSKDSPFDQFVARLTKEKLNTPTELFDSDNGFSVSAAKGLKLFLGKAKCITCHFGPNFSDGEFHHSFLSPVSLQGDLGRYDGIQLLLTNPFNGHGKFTDIKKGSRNKLDFVYLNVEFRGQFKTPSLRNVERTFPYMHTGEFKTLKDVIHYYNTISKRKSVNDHQEILLKSLELSKAEEKNLVVFLKSLNGYRTLSVAQKHSGESNTETGDKL